MDVVHILLAYLALLRFKWSDTEHGGQLEMGCVWELGPLITRECGWIGRKNSHLDLYECEWQHGERSPKDYGEERNYKR